MLQTSNTNTLYLESFAHYWLGGSQLMSCWEVRKMLFGIVCIVNVGRLDMHTLLE